MTDSEPTPGAPVVTLTDNGPERVTPLSDGSEVVERWERREDGSYVRTALRSLLPRTL